ncbi:hypothetical protein [Mycobacterium gordonae]|jgi:hypothetical protein|uniref:Secreted protein n=1 Tax=Mycobacterium gordonae TaxID=1778 RepID=A0A1A6B885_MYCGO|nr:hypothetical protein [Mycobacterium gordonae]MBI2698726.1 hypothetical protein [Mycobacterium sp.]MBX9979075.1 hypothetical protein [Mycobacterium gordonae]MCQ4364539.1 hypothetical protein [Mycobacterium gordonae]MCV7010555.1 hypothetical protein [Mycobacterium gordonae]OBR98453.1 hypothetical protein A9W98_35445 [Mycobacterium gordonae]
MRHWQFGALAMLGAVAISIAPADAAPGDDNTPPVDDLDGYPLASGTYSSSSFSWVYFTTPDGRYCGIAPNGGPIGCDTVPADAPPGTNQTFADATHPAQYRHSDTKTFTRNFPVLPAGYRVQTMGAVCAVDNQGAVHCQTEGNHGFILSTEHGVLW